MIEILLNEDLWFPASLGIGVAVLIIFIRRQRRAKISTRAKILSRMNLIYGVVIGTMGVGHLQAVTIKSAMGTIPEDTHQILIFPLGLAIAIPSWWLVICVRGLELERKGSRLTAMIINGWLAAVLLLPAIPLAFPAAINLGFLARWKPA